MSIELKYLNALLLAANGEAQELRKKIIEPAEAKTLWERHPKRGEIDPDREMEKLIKDGVWTIDKSDLNYPPLLKEAHDAPLLIYGKGKLPKFDESYWGIAIVGTRKPTEYGKAVARNFAEELSYGGAVIISGIAAGIDREAHAGALAGHGKTIAVIGSGLDRASFFPSANWSLAETIIADGSTVISEYPPGTPALPHHFPERNRIIAGLSHGTIVVEAQERSGALITARLALEENREVFAVPGPINSLTSRGPNLLLKEGATPALSPEDIFIAFDKAKPTTQTGRANLGEFEKQILEALAEPRSLDELKAMLSAETSKLQAALSLLELEGYIQETEPGKYAVWG